MRAKPVLVISLVVNAALGVAFLGLLSRLLDTPSDSEPDASVTFVTNGPLRISKTNIFLRPRTFTWRDLESTNYDLYVLNLRGIGCPESTVRDIILADVNLVYAHKRRELGTGTNDLQWWRSEPDAGEALAMQQKLQALEEERRKLLARLLGPNWEEGPESEPEPLLLNGPTLSLLTPEQKQAVQDIVARSHTAIRDYVRQCQQVGEAPDSVQLARLREDTRQQLAAQLNPQQMEEFLLRYSGNASQLRDQMRGFNTAPDEFRRLFAATDSIDRELAALSPNDPASAARRQALQAQRDTAIMQALGADRFQEYRMAKEPAYMQAMTEALDAGATTQAGSTLYEINQAASQERDRIRNDPNLTAAEKEKLLKDIEQERLEAKAQALGLEPPPDPRPKPQPPPAFQHNIAPGETLAGLSMVYRVPISELLKANPGFGDGLLPPGQTVKIPSQGQVPPPLPPPLPTVVGPFDKAGVQPR